MSVDLAALEGLQRYLMLREGKQLLDDAIAELRELRGAVVERKTAACAMTFTVPRPPAKKNEKQARRVGMPCRACKLPMGPVVQYDSHEVKKAHAAIQDVAVAALRQQHPQCYLDRSPLLPDEDVRVVMVHHVLSETLEVTVEHAGARPKGRTGRRNDVVNLPELVLDALQRIAFANDNQVADLRVVRALD